GLTKEQVNSGEGMGTTFLSTGILALVTAVTLGCLLIATNTTGLIDSKLLALVIGLVFRAGAHVMHNGFARRPGKLTLIDGAHDVVALTVMGGILGLWS